VFWCCYPIFTEINVSAFRLISHLLCHFYTSDSTISFHAFIVLCFEVGKTALPGRGLELLLYNLGVGGRQFCYITLYRVGVVRKWSFLALYNLCTAPYSYGNCLNVNSYTTCHMYARKLYIQGTSYIITFIHTFSLFWASWMLGVTKLNPDWQYLKFPYQFLKIIYKLAGPLAWNSLPPKIKRTSLTLGQYLLWPAENWNVHSQLYASAQPS